MYPPAQISSCEDTWLLLLMRAVFSLRGKDGYAEFIIVSIKSAKKERKKNAKGCDLIDLYVHHLITEDLAFKGSGNFFKLAGEGEVTSRNK